MARTVSIGAQRFEKIIENNYFYIDKTKFIREWWENGDEVTLITRPRRFGKTLNMSMLERFFSCRYAGDGQVFEGLSVWEDERFRALQGTYPVIFLSFANVKSAAFKNMLIAFNQILFNLFGQFEFLLEGNTLNEGEKEYFTSVSDYMDRDKAIIALQRLSGFLKKYYGKNCIILLDEYDTPMQEAWTSGYWDEAIQFLRELFNSTFKTNPFLERAVLTGITRISKESIFSDLNNLMVVTTTSEAYSDCFGFTEDEVFAAIDEFGLSNKEDVKKWYDGFIFGKTLDIYNPWSITNYLKTREIGLYWVNSSSNGLVGKLLTEGGGELKGKFEDLLQGKCIESAITEDIVFSQLDSCDDAVWSLLVSSGYLKILSYETMKEAEEDGRGEPFYRLGLTNREVRMMFLRIIRGWFKNGSRNYNGFVKALLAGNLREMNRFMNEVALSSFSFFDTGKYPGGKTEPERFYHGFVLGLLVELSGSYQLKSNRESGFGRYDVCLIPKKEALPGIILEFKVHDPEDGEKSLKDTVKAALAQIREKGYARELRDIGIQDGQIRSYGFAFQGKTVLIGNEEFAN